MEFLLKWEDEILKCLLSFKEMTKLGSFHLDMEIQHDAWLL